MAHEHSGPVARNGIPLDDPNSVVEASDGYLDVFAVAAGDGVTGGALHHVFRAGEKQPVIGGVKPPPGVARFMAVPGPNAQIELGTRESWLAAVEDASVEDVIEHLTDAIWEWSNERPREGFPGSAKRLVPGKRAAAKEGENLACDFGIVTIEIASGKFLFAGAPEAELIAEDRLFLTRHTWLQSAAADSKTNVYPHDAFEDVASAFDAYETFQRAYTQEACAGMVKGERAGSERMILRSRGIENGLDDGLLRMRKLLEPGATAMGAASGQSALLTAVKQVGAQQGIGFTAIKDAPATTTAHLQALADESGVRVRSVTLAGEWWKKDSGPLLAFRAEDEAPLVLTPRSGRRYFATDPASGDAVQVNSDFAAGLKPFAFTFYRPFPPVPIDVTSLIRFGLAGQGRDLRQVLGLGALIALLGLLVPIVTAEIVDRAIPSAQNSALLQFGLVLLAAAVVHSLFALAQGLMVLRVGSRLEHNIQAAVWDRVLGMPIDFFRDFAVGDLTMRVNAINMIYNMLSVHTLTSLLGGAFSLLTFIVLFKFSPGLALLALVIVLGAAAFLVAFGYNTVHTLHEMVGPSRKIMSLVLQLVQGVAKLRTTASEARAFGIWAGEFAGFRAIRFKILKLAAQQKLFFEAYHNIGMLLVFVTMGLLLKSPAGSGLSAGEFIGFFSAFTAMFLGVIGICETVVGLYLVGPMFKMAEVLLKTLPETSTGKTKPGRIAGAIEVSQVSFAYPDGDSVLEDVSFSVPAGSFTAIVGPSGSGKSTLLRLMLGFDAPGGGAILYDDKSLHDLDQRALRRQFGVVLQTSPLMAGDIFSNIVGVSGGTIDDAWEAARLAGLEEDIRALPMGMHTAIGEGTSTLSGGQRQRILIARALLGQPRILFLDEATSALDNQSQAQVAESLLRMKATRIVIAHRLSTIEQADQIIVLESGQVVQHGAYEELLEEDGLFAEMARRQSTGE